MKINQLLLIIKACTTVAVLVICRLAVSRLGVTIVAKNDYCDSIDIAGSAIAIILLLWTTIAILL